MKRAEVERTIAIASDLTKTAKAAFLRRTAVPCSFL